MFSLAARSFVVALSLSALFLTGCYTSAEIGEPSEETLERRRAARMERQREQREARETRVARDGDGREVREEPTADGRSVLAYPTGNRNTSALLIERLSPQEVRVGESYEYQIKVTNLTSATLSDVVVREKLPADFNITRAEPSGRNENGQQTFALGDLPPKQSKMIRVSATPQKPGNLDNCVTVSYTPTLCTTTNVINPMLKIVKQVNREADVCEPLVFRYTVSNVGTGAERNIRIEENLPEGLTTEDGKSVIAVDVGELAEGQSKEIPVRVKAAKAGRYQSNAVVRGGGTKEVTSEPVEVTVRQPKLEVAISGLASEYINKQSRYQVTVKNVGDAPARRTIARLDAGGRAELVTAATPEEKTGGSFDPNAPNGTISRKPRESGGGLTKDLGTLAPGDSRTVDFDLRMLKEGEMRVLASAVADCAPEVGTSIVTNIGTLPALRLEVIDVEDAIKLGENVVYRISVKNQGSGDDEDVRIVAVLPDEMEFIRASGETEATADGKTITFAPVTRLEPNKTAEWRIEAKAGKAGDVRFEVRMTSKSLTKPAVETEPTRLY
jgi:uncharacterized repeat protein (TIGR01451 family)